MNIAIPRKKSKRGSRIDVVGCAVAWGVFWNAVYGLVVVILGSFWGRIAQAASGLLCGQEGCLGAGLAKQRVTGGGVAILAPALCLPIRKQRFNLGELTRP